MRLAERLVAGLLCALLGLGLASAETEAPAEEITKSDDPEFVLPATDLPATEAPAAIDGTSAPPPASPVADTTASPEAGAPTPGTPAGPSAQAGPCTQRRPEDEGTIDEARRRLEETTCGAALWFDGLFGDDRHVSEARRTYGRVELSAQYSEYEGTKVRGKLKLRAKFPNWEERVEAFLGRDDDDDFVRDRQEGFALRSQFLGGQSAQSWLAGLGYSAPGKYELKTDTRIGVKLGSQPEIFVQGRLRRNWSLSEKTNWNARETVFWTNRDGFGTTTSINFDRVLATTRLLRWGNVGTWSEETDGLDWRSAVIVYQNLRLARAMAYEAFVRGSTDASVPLREYGARSVYRQRLLRRDDLWGEVVLGYSWPRREPEEKREGSLSFGFGVELLFGRQPKP